MKVFWILIFGLALSSCFCEETPQNEDSANEMKLEDKSFLNEPAPVESGRSCKKYREKCNSKIGDCHCCDPRETCSCSFIDWTHCTCQVGSTNQNHSTCLRKKIQCNYGEHFDCGKDPCTGKHCKG